MKYITVATAATILTISSRTTAPQSLPAQTSAQPAAIVQSEFVYETAPFPSVHASTIVDTRAGLVIAFFGGLAKARRTSASGSRVT